MATETDKSESIIAIRDWMAHPVTKEIWDRFKNMMEDGDRKCHAALEKGNFQEASNWNAYQSSINEVIELPGLMIDEANENK